MSYIIILHRHLTCMMQYITHFEKKYTIFLSACGLGRRLRHNIQGGILFNLLLLFVTIIRSHCLKQKLTSCQKRKNLALFINRSAGLRPLACWDRGLESLRGHGYLSVASVLCCHVEVSATSWPLVQRSPTTCGASLCVMETSWTGSQTSINSDWTYEISSLQGTSPR
jgi:hypothetical protein